MNIQSVQMIGRTLSEKEGYVWKCFKSYSLPEDHTDDNNLFSFVLPSEVFYLKKKNMLP